MRTFLKIYACRFGAFFGGVFVFPSPEVIKLFFARAFAIGACEAFLYVFDWGARKNNALESQLISFGATFFWVPS